MPYSNVALMSTERMGPPPGALPPMRMVVALARKLIIALWRFVTTGEPLEGVVLRPAP